MADITFSPDPIPTAIRGRTVNQTVDVSVPGSINKITVELVGEQDEIEISTSNSGFTIKGKYVSGWTDIFTYVEAGESDKTDTPKTAIDIPNMPPDKNLYDLNQDKKQSIFRDYNVSVEYEDETTFEKVSASASISHQVDNDLDAMKDFMANYNYNGG
jgi:hypothetical protein